MKFVALLMAFVLVIAMVPSVFAVGQNQIQENSGWVKEAVESVRERFMNENTFREQIKQQVQECKDNEDIE